MKTRIKFSKCGSMRFVGHLDVMRYFQKAFRRAQIPVSYSQGFSPHQLMSFSSPLGIGLSSDGEYMDLTLDQVEDADRIVEQMNEQMNEEIRVRNLTILKDDARPSMAMLAACDYMIAAKPDKTSFLERVDLEELVHRFMEQSSIKILKKTKRSEKEVDIRAYRYEVRRELPGGVCVPPAALYAAYSRQCGKYKTGAGLRGDGGICRRYLFVFGCSDPSTGNVW